MLLRGEDDLNAMSAFASISLAFFDTVAAFR
jgi:hypothetical protein